MGKAAWLALPACRDETRAAPAEGLRGSQGLGRALSSECVLNPCTRSFICSKVLLLVAADVNQTAVRSNHQSRAFHGRIFKGLQQFVVPTVTNFVGTL